MPRIRTIKPELPEDEKLGSVPVEARYLAIMLITMADDRGNLRGTAGYVRGHAFPYDDLTIATVQGWLDDLAEIGFIGFYLVNGERFINITQWAKHQKVKNPATVYPIPGIEDGESTETLRRADGDSNPRAHVLPATSYQLPTTKEPKKERAVVTFASLSHGGEHADLMDKDTKRGTAARVFAVWCESWEMAPNTQFTKKRERLAVKALDHSSEGDLLGAIDGMRKDPWEERRKHNDFDKLLDTRDRVEGWLRNLGVTPTHTEPEKPAKDWQLERRMYEKTHDGMALDAAADWLLDMLSQEDDADVQSWAAAELEERNES